MLWHTVYAERISAQPIPPPASPPEPSPIRQGPRHGILAHPERAHKGFVEPSMSEFRVVAQGFHRTMCGAPCPLCEALARGR